MQILIKKAITHNAQEKSGGWMDSLMSGWVDEQEGAKAV